MPYVSQKVLALTLPSNEVPLGTSIGFQPLETSLQTVYWTPVCINRSMFHQLPRIDAKIPFVYSETTREHAPNH